MTHQDIEEAASRLAEQHYNVSDRVVSTWGYLSWENIREWSGGKEGDRWRHAARTGEVPTPNEREFAMPLKRTRTNPTKEQREKASGSS
jgi:hypothetical protein